MISVYRSSEREKRKLRAARGSGITATKFVIPSPNQVLTHAARAAAVVGLQPTVIASRAPHLLLEQSVRFKESWTRASPVKAAAKGPGQGK